MKSVLISPRKYIQGRGVLRELGSYLKLLGRRPMIVWDECVKGIVGQAVLASIAEAGLEAVEVMFQGEATAAERARVAQIAREAKVDISVGIGGGKILDIGKAAAVDCGLRMVTCPTIASNDSPTSAASVWYNEQGDFVGFDCWPFNPDIVMVDSAVVAGAPVRPFVAGMGDALSTWIECEAAYQSRAANIAGGQPTMAALAIARLCYDTLLEYGREAKRDLEQKLVTPAVEKVIEANVLLSGLGFESGGLATAHMIGNLLSNQPQCKRFMHGEKVGFGIVAQLCLDDAMPVARKHLIVDFEIDIGLPVTLADLKLDTAPRAQIRALAEACAAEGSLCHNHAFAVTADDVFDAIYAADALGRERKQVKGIRG
jgi:glycerol dehydrogenase